MDIIRQAINSGLVIVFGSSNDRMVIEGAIGDDLEAMGGRTISVYKYSVLGSKDDIHNDKDLNKWLKNKSASKEIDAMWACDDNYSWTYKTDIPHATFAILKAGSSYCRGIVFSVDEI
jgi:hypothetical protein